MVIFSGWGTILVLIAGGGLAVLLGESNFSWLLAGIVIAVGGFFINAHDGNGPKVKNTLFWIPIEYWGVIVVVASVFRLIL